MLALTMKGEGTIDRLHGVSVFLSVVETQNFSETARALGVTTSAVSATVQRLEQKLAVRLLNRTTRRVLPTLEGQEFYQRCKHILADLEQAEAAVSRAAGMPSGRLRISMPSALARMYIIPRLGEFTRAYPLVSLEILAGDFIAASSREGLDAAIQVGELPASRMIVRKLAAVDYVVCAAPAYLAEHGAPGSPADLANHACIGYRRPRNGQIRQWRFSTGLQSSTPAVGSAMILNGGEALIAAASAGLGLIQVAEYYAQPEFASGRLIEVLSGYKTHAYDISVVFQQRKRIAPRLRVFIDYLIAMFETPPWKVGLR
ncbi:MAG TPA: LysR family transcriptional regulator [Stellaceae bacterium]|nr:LysR family transcriptional regulator [Stellaceae bacterium]